MDYIKIDCIGSFFKNAGIVGLIRFLRHNNAKENTDYIMKGETLSLSVDYLKNNDISQMYVDTMVEIFEKDTKFYKVVYEESNIINAYYEKGFENLKEKEIQKLNDLFKSFKDMLLKSSFKATFELLNKEYNIDKPIITIAENFRDEKDINKKYELYCELIDIITNDITIKTQLIYTELLYNQFKLFFSENAQSHKITILDKNIKRENTINNNFIQPIFNDYEIDIKEKKDTCIECFENTKNKRDNTFMVDTADDTKRKKSYYWNCIPSAFVCPVCAFVYSFVPLGFAFFSNDAIFVNINDSVEHLFKMMNTYRQKSENDEHETYYQRLFKVFSNKKIDMLSESLSNIQVIIKNNGQSHFSMKIIDNNIIKHLKECEKYFEKLEKSKKRIKIGKKDGKDIWANVYNVVLDNILSYKSQYSFIDKCIRYELSQDGHFGYIKNILKIEINFNGGANVQDLKKLVDIAFICGKDMRVNLLGKEKAFNNENEIDNTLRSYVYRLANLSSVGDVAQFLDTVIRMYSGYSLTIPFVFKECYTSEETFKAIAHGYILGLKYKKYEKKENDENE